MIHTFEHGGYTIARFCEVLGIDPKKYHVRRLVIDIEMNSIAKVYLQLYPTSVDLERFAKLMAESESPKIEVLFPDQPLSVDEKGNVHRTGMEIRP